jgi:hypothetical protein
MSSPGQYSCPAIQHTMMMKTTWFAARVCAVVLTAGSPAVAATIAVPAGGNLQQAINSAQPGDTITLQPGATYIGPFTLPAKTGNAFITIRTAGDAGLPGEGTRVSPMHAPALAKIKSGTSAPAIQTRDGAHHWRLALVEIQANAAGSGDIMTLGDGSSAQRSLAQIAHDLVVDRVYLHGDPGKSHKRGIALNSASTTITGSYIADIKAVGMDSQAIGGWNGPGPFTITNNYLEGAGENLMFGGADPSVPGLVPSDITIAGNHFAKQLSWRTEKWVVKNLIELKNARRVTIARNTFEYNWQGGQSGYAVVFTVRNQDGNCPWCQVANVTFEQNVVRHSAAGISILGYDNNHPSQQTQAIVVRNNVFADIDSRNWGGNGYFLSLTGGARDITIEHNTIIQGHASGLITLDGPPVLGFVFRNNLAKHSTYGIFGNNRGVGNDAIAAFLPGSEITRNVIAGASASKYPGGNSFPTVAQFETQFAAYAAGDYRLVEHSPWRDAGTDGFDLGAVLGSGGPAPTPVPRSAQPVEGEGVVTGTVAGTSCPAADFMIGGYRVKVDPSTQFSGGGCANVGIGAKVAVKGSLRDDGSVFAAQMAIVGVASPRAAEGRGTVTALVPSSCPSLQVMIGPYTVALDAATQFAAGSCRDIAIGTILDVTGVFITDTAVAASRIGVVR